jgi:hypothetical protein
LPQRQGTFRRRQELARAFLDKIIHLVDRKPGQKLTRDWIAASGVPPTNQHGSDFPSAKKVIGLRVGARSDSWGHCHARVGARVGPDRRSVLFRHVSRSLPRDHRWGGDLAISLMPRRDRYRVVLVFGARHMLEPSPAARGRLSNFRTRLRTIRSFYRSRIYR